MLRWLLFPICIAFFGGDWGYISGGTGTKRACAFQVPNAYKGYKPMSRFSHNSVSISDSEKRKYMLTSDTSRGPLFTSRFRALRMPGRRTREVVASIINTIMSPTELRAQPSSSPTASPSRIAQLVLEKVPLSSIVSKYVKQMKITKKNQYVCLCPFHDDKNPSFGVNDEKGLYHCFSCGAKGNTIGFVMAIEQVPYKEAVTKILHATDIDVSTLNLAPSPKQAPVSEAEQRQLQLLARAANYFQARLARDPRAGAARAHLMERGVSVSLVKKYRIGYAPAAVVHSSSISSSSSSSSSSVNTSNSISSSNTSTATSSTSASQGVVASHTASAAASRGIRPTEDLRHTSLLLNLTAYGYNLTEIVAAGLAINGSEYASASASSSLYGSDSSSRYVPNRALGSNSSSSSSGSSSGVPAPKASPSSPFYRNSGTISSTSSSNATTTDRSAFLNPKPSSAAAPPIASKVTIINLTVPEIIRKDNIYERFRNRLIIPICNERGDVIGFGGRILPSITSASSVSKSAATTTSAATSTTAATSAVAPVSPAAQAKYINSPETALFKKSKILFGYSAAKAAIHSRGLALLVEGYFDVISLHAVGIDYAVGSMGTAVSKEQIELAASASKEGVVVLLLDDDEAGQRATQRIVQQITPSLSPGVQLRVACLNYLGSGRANSNAADPTSISGSSSSTSATSASDGFSLGSGGVDAAGNTVAISQILDPALLSASAAAEAGGTGRSKKRGGKTKEAVVTNATSNCSSSANTEVFGSLCANATKKDTTTAPLHVFPRFKDAGDLALYFHSAFKALLPPRRYVKVRGENLEQYISKKAKSARSNSAAQLGAATLAPSASSMTSASSSTDGSGETNYARRYVELIVRSAVSWQQYVLDSAMRPLLDSGDMKHFSKVVEDVAEVLAGFNAPADRTYYAYYCAQKISLGNGRLKDQLEVDILALVAAKRRKMPASTSSSSSTGSNSGSSRFPASGRGTTATSPSRGAAGGGQSAYANKYGRGSYYSSSSARNSSNSTTTSSNSTTTSSNSTTTSSNINRSYNYKSYPSSNRTAT